MNNNNLDKALQDKLKDLNCEYKPEYWDRMKTVISTSSLSQVSATATQTATSAISTASIIGISTVAIIIGAISFYIFKPKNTDDCSETSKAQEIIVIDNKENASDQTTIKLSQETINNNILLNTNKSEETASTNIKVVTATTNRKIAQQNKINNNSSNESTSYIEETELFTKSNIELLNNYKSLDSDKSKNNCGETLINDISIDELNTESFDNHIENDEVVEVSIQNTNNSIDSSITKDSDKAINNANSNKRKQKVKIDETELKNVKPMRKPSGKIFRRKGGLFGRK